jgi:hypothetical protein
MPCPDRSFGAAARLAVGSLAVTVVVAGTLTGCGPRSFRQPHELSITSPRPLAVVAAPVHLAWTAHHRLVAGTSYAVFIDRPTVHPGQTLQALADSGCRRTPGCPDARYLQTLGVYVTSNTHLDLAQLPTQRGAEVRQPHPVHTAMIVVLDGHGRRANDGAYTVEFRTGSSTA